MNSTFPDAGSPQSVSGRKNDCLEGGEGITFPASSTLLALQKSKSTKNYVLITTKTKLDIEKPNPTRGEGTSETREEIDPIILRRDRRERLQIHRHIKARIAPLLCHPPADHHPSASSTTDVSPPHQDRSTRRELPPSKNR